MVDADSKLQSHKGTEVMYKIRQTNYIVSVRTQQFPLIQVLVQEKKYLFSNYNLSKKNSKPKYTFFFKCLGQMKKERKPSKFSVRNK